MRAYQKYIYKPFCFKPFSVPSVPSVVEKRKTTMEIRKNTERMKYESVKKVLNLYFFRAFSAFSG